MTGAATAKCPRCGYVRVALAGTLSAACPACDRAAQPSASPAPAYSAPVTIVSERSDSRLAATLIASVLAIIVLYTCSQIASNAPPRSSVASESSRALIACRGYISDRLHDRSSVEWGDDSVSTQGPQYIVAMEFRAKNGFGAYRLTTYICTVEKGSFRVVSADNIK